MSNVFTALGHLTKDCEISKTPNGMSVLHAMVATNQGHGTKRKTMYVKAALLGRKAETGLNDYLLKGQQVQISGELYQNEYEAKDGAIKINMEMVANNIILVGKKGDVYRAVPVEDEATKNESSYENYFDEIPF